MSKPIVIESNGHYGLAMSGDNYQIIDLNASDLNNIETNGHYSLAKGGDTFYVLDASGNSIRLNKDHMIDVLNAGWVPLQVEGGEHFGGFEVLMHNDAWAYFNGGYSSRKFDTDGVLAGFKNASLTRHESWFQFDLNNDESIVIDPDQVPYLTDISGNKHHEDDGYGASLIINFGNISRNGNWSVTQVEASVSGGYELFYVHSDGRTMAHKIDATGAYQATITRTMVQHETAFQADLDGDGVIGLNLIEVESNGSYKLATATNQYHIIDANDATADIINFGNISRNGNWSVTQVEASVSGGYELFYVHSDGRTMAHKIDATGAYQSTITRTIAQHETAFQADLNGDGIDSGDNYIFDSIGKNYFDGGAGDDHINGWTGHDTIIGGDGDDEISGDGSSGYAGNDILFGNAGNDWLRGRDGDDQIDGGTGSDTIITDSGLDQIILRIGDGGNTLSEADIITDFTDGSDYFGLTNGLSFGDLTRTQGTGSYANDAIIKYGSEYLAILQNIDVSLLTEADFEDVDIA